MEEAEQALMAAAGAGRHNVLAMLSDLTAATVFEPGNFGTNRKLWDRYATEWSPTSPWVTRMAEGSGNRHTLECVGDEWSGHDDFHHVVDTFIMPYTGSEVDAVEVGVGGGRVARRYAGSVRTLHVLDISRVMLDKARRVLAGVDHIAYSLQDSNALPGVETASVGLLVCFDVLVHCDLHVTMSYLREFCRVLKPGGRAFLSFADVTSPGGWERFASQQRASVAGFCFTSPDAVRFLVGKAGLRIVREGQRAEDNVYLRRDFLVVVEPAPPAEA